MSDEDKVRDREKLENALELLKSSEDYQRVSEDPDWNITQAVDSLEAHLKGDWWI